MRILGLVPARGGSKGLARKNLRRLGGQTLVERAFAAGSAAGVLDRIVLSTDDAEIRTVAERAGMEVPFLRPAPLSDDHAAMIDVVLHALDALREIDGYEPDAVMLLQPTAPFRTAAHLRKAVELLGDEDSVCSVVPLPLDECPHFVMRIDDDGHLDHFLPDGPSYTRRQDVPRAYRREGTVYLTRANVLREKRSFYGARCVPMVLSPEESLNIDDEADWAEARRRQGRRKT